MYTPWFTGLYSGWFTHRIFVTIGTTKPRSKVTSMDGVWKLNPLTLLELSIAFGVFPFLKGDRQSIC